MWNPCNGKHSNENFLWNFSDLWTLLLLFISCKNVQVYFTFSMPQFCLGVKSVRESVLLSGHWADCTASVIREPRGSDHKVSITHHCLCGPWGFGGIPCLEVCMIIFHCFDLFTLINMVFNFHKSDSWKHHFFGDNLKFTANF